MVTASVCDDSDDDTAIVVVIGSDETLDVDSGVWSMDADVWAVAVAAGDDNDDDPTNAGPACI